MNRNIAQMLAMVTGHLQASQFDCERAADGMGDHDLEEARTFAEELLEAVVEQIHYRSAEDRAELPEDPDRVGMRRS